MTYVELSAASCFAVAEPNTDKEDRRTDKRRAKRVPKRRQRHKTQNMGNEKRNANNSHKKNQEAEIRCRAFAGALIVGMGIALAEACHTSTKAYEISLCIFVIGRLIR